MVNRFAAVKRRYTCGALIISLHRGHERRIDLRDGLAGVHLADRSIIGEFSSLEEAGRVVPPYGLEKKVERPVEGAADRVTC